MWGLRGEALEQLPVGLCPSELDAVPWPVPRCPPFPFPFHFPFLTATFQGFSAVVPTVWAVGEGFSVCSDCIDATAAFSSLTSRVSSFTLSCRDRIAVSLRLIRSSWRAALQAGHKNGSEDVDKAAYISLGIPAHQRWCQHSQAPSQYTASCSSLSTVSFSITSWQMGHIASSASSPVTAVAVVAMAKILL